jgi:putative endonuclease
MIYYVYILTNITKRVLYTGVTNNLKLRLIQHRKNKGNPKTFAGGYFCFYLLYYEIFQYPLDAIGREKEIKKLSRERKIELIKKKNKRMDFLNIW